jgi:nucleoid-associated protein YgaU|tara:strand:- start:493 stop:792 length:300 start_codon:yes stop_codon:yes gene_type:complete
MKRYSSTPRKIDKSGIRVYGTTYYPEIPLDNKDSFVYAVDGDRLDSLAYKHYGDATLWWIIAKANGLRGKPTLTPGKVIRIPSNIANIIEKFRNLNTTG